MRVYKKEDFEVFSHSELVSYAFNAQQAQEREKTIRRDAERKLADARQRIRDLEDLARTYKYRAEHESITGLLRKDAAEEEIVRTLNELDEDEKKRTCLLFLDIDDFKRMNDTFGHNEGDAVLRRLGEIVLELRRRGSVAGRGDAGDEIIIFLRDTTIEEATHIGERIAELSAKQTFYAFNQSGVREGYRTGVSFGVAVYPGDVTFEEWKHLADQDMYVRKRARKTAKGVE